MNEPTKAALLAERDNLREQLQAQDPDARAIAACVKALSGLQDGRVTRVLDYLAARFPETRRNDTYNTEMLTAPAMDDAAYLRRQLQEVTEERDSLRHRLRAAQDTLAAPSPSPSFRSWL